MKGTVTKIDVFRVGSNHEHYVRVRFKLESDRTAHTYLCESYPNFARWHINLKNHPPKMTWPEPFLISSPKRLDEIIRDCLKQLHISSLEELEEPIDVNIVPHLVIETFDQLGEQGMSQAMSVRTIEALTSKQIEAWLATRACKLLDEESNGE